MAGLLKHMLKRLYFYVIKIPFVYFMVTIGFVFEWLLTLPFIILVSIDAYRQKKPMR